MMRLTGDLHIDGAHELVAAIRLDVPLEDYRERLTPLAEAILQGASRRTVERRRDLVLPDVWDASLERAVREGVERLGALVALAAADARRPVQQRRLAHAVVDRLMFELLENHNRNLVALEELEAELREMPFEDRCGAALRAVRGACASARIPRNEIRAAIVHTSRAAATHGLGDADAADEGLRHLARTLASGERRERARGWVAAVATIHDEHLPVLADELRRLAAVPAPQDPGQDPIWLETCLGLALVENLERGNCS